MKMTRRLPVVLGFFCLLAFGPAIADTQTQGQVGLVETVGSGGGAPGAYDFRIFLSTGGTICNGYNWTYVNVSDANYQTIVANVLTAKALGSTVTLDVTIDGGTGYCHLSWLSIQ